MTQYKDKNGTLLKVNDKVKTELGTVYTITNINGVTRMARVENRKIIETLNMKKFDFDGSEKV